MAVVGRTPLTSRNNISRFTFQVRKSSPSRGKTDTTWFSEAASSAPVACRRYPGTSDGCPVSDERYNGLAQQGWPSRVSSMGGSHGRRETGQMSCPAILTVTFLGRSGPSGYSGCHDKHTDVRKSKGVIWSMRSVYCRVYRENDDTLLSCCGPGPGPCSVDLYASNNTFPTGTHRVCVCYGGGPHSTSYRG